MENKTVSAALSLILKKAQGRIDEETRQPIDVGQEVLQIGHEFEELRAESDLLRELREFIPLLRQGADAAEPYRDVSEGLAELADKLEKSDAKTH